MRGVVSPSPVGRGDGEGREALAFALGAEPVDGAAVLHEDEQLHFFAIRESAARSCECIVAVW